MQPPSCIFIHFIIYLLMYCDVSHLRSNKWQVRLTNKSKPCLCRGVAHLFVFEWRIASLKVLDFVSSWYSPQYFMIPIHLDKNKEIIWFHGHTKVYCSFRTRYVGLLSVKRTHFCNFIKLNYNSFFLLNINTPSTYYNKIEHHLVFDN